VSDRRSIFRLLALAGFLLTVALALWLAELRPVLVLVVMAAAVLVAGVIEWLWWRRDVVRSGSEVEVEVAAAPSPPPPAFAAPARDEPTAPPVDEAPGPPPEAPPPPPEDPEPAPAAAAPEPPPPPPARTPLRPVPTPPPQVEPPAPEPIRPAAPAKGVIDMRTRVTAQPRRWNLWDLERRAREAQRDPVRYEEWSFLFVHLRQFATPDGSLPTEFDELVRESFGELLEHPG
jgi:outer membrane biosynthesis protein TonB